MRCETYRVDDDMISVGDASVAGCHWSVVAVPVLDQDQDERRVMDDGCQGMYRLETWYSSDGGSNERD